jgi:hypothetical protein
MQLQKPKLPVERIYEPNIIHNPRGWFGIWTPDGWRVHEKRFGNAERITVELSGDGKTTFFPEALRDPQSGKMEWQDDLHVMDDSFTDGGIYACEPRVEYPVGRPRWAISHTLLCYPVADHTLSTHEYRWDMTHGHLQTHFRRHVVIEAARTDSTSGRTVQLAHAPLSTTIEGNVCYPHPNSAVRGVWASAEKSGQNFYARRAIELLPMLNGVYALTPHSPVVQCHGAYATLPDDPLSSLFDLESGAAHDWQELQSVLKIPVDTPRVAMLRFPLMPARSNAYGCNLEIMSEIYGVVDSGHLSELHKRLGTAFVSGKVGYGRNDRFDGSVLADGYLPAFDFNNNGVIDEEDAQLLESQLGREVRHNLYLDAYFGNDWVSTSVSLEVENRPGAPLIADYEYGGGYDAQVGIVHLLDTPGPDQPVWVEYFYDAPAEAGENNIRVHLYRER